MPGLDASTSCGRILLVTPQPFYEDRGTPIALRYVLEALSERGFEVDVLAFPMGCSVPIPRVRYVRSANPLRFRSVPIGLSLRKLVLDAFLVASLRRLLRSVRYDAIHAVEEAAFPAVWLARKRGIFVHYDMASCLSEQLAVHPLFGAPPAHAVIRRLERWLLRHAAHVSCSAGLGARVRELAPETSCREWIYPSHAPQVPPSVLAALREELGLAKDMSVVLYTGSFAAYQGVPLLLEAIPRVLRDTERVAFVLVGAADEGELSAAQAPLGSCEPARVKLLGRQPKDRIPAFLALADLLVSPRCHGDNLPLKIFDYLATGKAIVASDIAAHRAVLDPSRAVLVEPTATGLAEGILGLLRDPERAGRLAETARRYAAEALAWPRFVETLGGIYEEGIRAARRS